MYVEFTARKLGAITHSLNKARGDFDSILIDSLKFSSQ